ncbi:ureidoglycolate lyase [Caballeronia grimmiae]|uniref:Ureidoglycolate hydrolase n=1 Tax=Caballeronia grimmiae TaxID=1071679 RepID=A0A069NTU1_9BURK|nr:ureidoglycolate lyase [Caballeronia grimmiae]KDR31039.1 ureidoglycolate hydrolase [Caballeronia grimmiae]GGD94372.1 ureidoglycolate lyase [Caballeronia grimmiae]
MTTSPAITIEKLDATACAPYGVMLGTPPRADDPSTFLSPQSDFWRAQLFETGDTAAEILWVVYREQPLSVSTLEAHHLTQQAVVPLTGSIIQILATSDDEGNPNLRTLRAFEIKQGQGLCMYARTWHATRVRKGETACLMLTRASTTRDLATSLRDARLPVETVLCHIDAFSLHQAVAS